LCYVNTLTETKLNEYEYYNIHIHEYYNIHWISEERRPKKKKNKNKNNHRLRGSAALL